MMEFAYGLLSEIITNQTPSINVLTITGIICNSGHFTFEQLQNRSKRIYLLYRHIHIDSNTYIINLLNIFTRL